jgi:ABC-type dipeptide/oligopeptide/nickel transport system ATPase subunit
MAISWMDFSIINSIKPFSLSLEKKDFLFLAGETSFAQLLRALAGFLPEKCNSAEAIRINGKYIKNKEIFKSVLLPKNAAESLPPHRTIESFILDLSPNITKKELEGYAGEYGINKHILNCKPSKISPLDLQKISLWLCSLNTSSVLFIEEPECGFFDECRPFDILQRLLKNSVTDHIVYLPAKKETVFQKSKIMQFCRARIAVFCADRLVEEGEAAKILNNPIHSYTKEWIEFGSRRQQISNGSLWQYCKPNCREQYNCSAKQSMSSVMWDCEPKGLHKVVCKGFFY